MCKRWAIHFKFIYPRAGPRDSARDRSPQDTQCAACATWGNFYQHATEVSIVRTDTCMNAFRIPGLTLLEQRPACRDGLAYGRPSWIPATPDAPAPPR